MQIAGQPLRHQTQGEGNLNHMLAQVAAPIETAATLPHACYSDSEVCRLEQQAIFRRSWVSIGRADHWRSKGDYRVVDVSGTSVVVVRGGDGELRAFANTCRHRGMMLIEGEGNISSLTCPFHGWRYDLEGRLRMAPDIGQQAGFPKNKLGLVPFRVATSDGFAFLCLDPDQPALNEWLGDFSARHAPWQLGELVTSHHRRFEVACNWKSFLEVFCESYHLDYVHSGPINDLYARPDPGDKVAGSYASQFGATNGSGAVFADQQDKSFPVIASLQDRNRQGTRYTWVFPNLAFAASTESIWIYEAQPLGPDRCLVDVTFCFPRDTTELPDFPGRAQLYYERIQVALDEDIPVLERQQRGYSNAYGAQGRFCVDLEPNVANFAVWYADRMRQVL